VSTDRERSWQDATGCSTPSDAKRRLRGQEDKIEVLADALEEVRRCNTTARKHPYAAVPSPMPKVEAALRLAGRPPMSDLSRQKDLEEARAVREHNEAMKRRTAIVGVMRVVKADRKTVKRWKEVGNG
jgi:hypothetical protein